MKNVAIYARYSTDQQRDTSLEDQIFRCEQVAARAGLSVNSDLIFTDAALSGTAKHTDRREGYQALLAALDAGQIDVLITDEFSRLSRDAVDQALFIRRLEENQRLRMLTADGMDTSLQNWQMSVGMTGLMAQQFVRDTTHRVKRGMLGQLERGYMIATPALGYVLKRVHDGAGNHVGSHWEIHEPDAQVVRSIFERRGQGESMHQIARWLNDEGVSTCRPGRARQALYWRAARVKNLLRNPIYRGEFHYNGSTTYQSRAQKKGIEVSVRCFARPELRLVADELWHRCNENIISRSGYGGGKHAFSGLIECGHCTSTLVLSSSRHRSRSMYCASCTSAKSMNGDKQALTSTVSVEGVKHMLTTALKEFMTPAFVAAFRERLRAKLLGKHDAELDTEKACLAHWEKVRERLSHLLATEDDPVLMERYQEAKRKHHETNERLLALEARQVNVDKQAIEAQLAVEPTQLIEGLFDDTVPPEQLRSILVRLFPEIVFEGKTMKLTSRFRLRFSLASALAVASRTEETGQMLLERTYQLRFSQTPGRPEAKKWIVTAVK